MASKRFTDQSIERLNYDRRKAPPSGGMEIRDDVVRGLLLRVTPRDVKSFSVIYKVPGEGGVSRSGRLLTGKQHRITLGTTPPLGLKEAREQARKIIEAATEGRDPRNERREKMMFGPGLSPGEEAVQATGIEAVLPRDEFGAGLSELLKNGRAIYTPFRPEVLGSASSSDPANLWKANKNDPWDGRSSREEAFIEHLKKASSQSEIKDLDPILDKMRGTKSASHDCALKFGTPASLKVGIFGIAFERVGSATPSGTS